MELLVVILKKMQIIDELLKELAEGGIKGATILDGTGMAEALMNMEDLPMFGLLRKVLADDDRELSKVMLIVLTDEQMLTARKIIRRVVGDLNAPNTGIMFTLPVTYVEGLGD